MYPIFNDSTSVKYEYIHVSYMLLGYVVTILKELLQDLLS